MGSTKDKVVFDLYSGKCEIIKAGAPTTFIKSKEGVEEVTSVTLPVGVLQNIEIEILINLKRKALSKRHMAELY